MKSVSVLFSRVSLVGSEDIIEGLESRLSPNDESSECSTGGKFEEVKSVDVAGVNTNNVSSGLGNLSVCLVVVVDNEWSLSDDVSSVSKLSLSGSDFLGVNASSDFIFTSETNEGLEEGRGLIVVEGVNNKWYFRDFLDSVSSSKNKWCNSSSSNS